MNTEDVSDVGQGKATTTVMDKYDKQQGTYKPTVNTVPTEDRLPQAAMPKGVDPSPFTVGPMTSGGR